MKIWYESFAPSETPTPGGPMQAMANSPPTESDDPHAYEVVMEVKEGGAFTLAMVEPEPVVDEWAQFEASLATEAELTPETRESYLAEIRGRRVDGLGPQARELVAEATGLMPKPEQCYKPLGEEARRILEESAHALGHRLSLTAVRGKR